MDIKRFSEIIKELIYFKSGTTTVPIRAESWEELIWATLVFMFGDDKVLWDPQSHEKSVDIKVVEREGSFKISAKAGEIKNDKIAISSYRLTTFDRLEEKLSFIKDQHENFDFYLICARRIRKDRDITYYVIKVPSNKLAPEWFVDIKNWRKTASGYELKEGLKFYAKIVFKMSHQLWYSIPMDYFSNEIIAKVTVPKDKLGKGLIEFLKTKFG